MRDYDNAEHTGADSGRTQARRSSPAPPAQLRDLLGLQATVGNAAVVQMLRRAGHPGSQPARHRHTADGAGRTGQPAVQRSTVHDVLRSSGRPLDEALRTDMEARLGADFSDVRVHTGAAARASAAEVGARAYTSGNHVVIGEGGHDEHTLAHELTHVLQQRQGPVAGTDNGAGLKVSDPSDRFEREAEANATRVMHGSPPATSPEAAAERAQRKTRSTGGVQRVSYAPGDEVKADPGRSVILTARLNGIDIGTFTSENEFSVVKQDHAEDQLIDEIQAAIGFAGQGLAQLAVAGAGQRIHDALDAGINAGMSQHQLQIELSASPCSTEFGTSNKEDAKGCAERLAELAHWKFGNQDQFSLAISIRAHHLYQPKGVSNAKKLSEQVNDWLRKQGIQVSVGSS